MEFRVGRRMHAHHVEFVLLYCCTRAQVGFQSVFFPRFKSFFKYARCYTHSYILMTDTKCLLRRNRLPAPPPRRTLCIGPSTPVVYRDAAVCTGALGAKPRRRLTQESWRIHSAMKMWSTRRISNFNSA